MGSFYFAIKDITVLLVCIGDLVSVACNRFRACNFVDLSLRAECRWDVFLVSPCLRFKGHFWVESFFAPVCSRKALTFQQYFSQCSSRA